MEETAHNSRKGPAQCRRHQNDAGSGAVRRSAAAVTRAGHSGSRAGLRPDIAAVEGWMRLHWGDVASMVSPNLHRPLRSSKRHRNIPAGNRGGCAEHSSTTAPLSWPPLSIRNVHHSNCCDLRRGMSQVLLRINVGPGRCLPPLNGQSKCTPAGDRRVPLHDHRHRLALDLDTERERGHVHLAMGGTVIPRCR